ncbi:MAG TPA: hypothetical protein VG271_09820 [Beijerinckiaceae bacterium]|nr:hypothetical protein [Beijerinckiaceae bacterium]
MLGIAFVAAFLNAMERRFALVLCAIVMAVTGMIFAASANLATLTVLGLGFNLMSTVYSAALSIYAAELFPTAWRAF